MPKIYVLRLGHRRERDKRVTTHCGLVARAFGASGILLSGEKDEKVEESIRRVVKIWGGPFDVLYESDWKKVIKEWKSNGGVVVHLTMYGIPIKDLEQKLRCELESKDILVVIGAEKVPRDVYEEANYNVSITNQPHSEVAALAIFLDRIFQGKELEKEFLGWKQKVIPQERGKKIIKRTPSGLPS